MGWISYKTFFSTKNKGVINAMIEIEYPIKPIEKVAKNFKKKLYEKYFN